MSNDNSKASHLNAAEAKKNSLANEISSLHDSDDASLLKAKQAEMDAIDGEILGLENMAEGAELTDDEAVEKEKVLSGDVSGKDGMIFHINVDSRTKPALAPKGDEEKGPREIPSIQNAAKAALKDMLDSTGGTDYDTENPKFKSDMKEFYKVAMDTLGSGKPLMRSDFLKFMEENGHDIPEMPEAGMDSRYSLMKADINNYTHVAGSKEELENGDVAGKSIFFGGDIFKAGVAESSGSLFIGDFNKVTKDFSLAHALSGDATTFAPDQDQDLGQGPDLRTPKL